MSKRRLIFLSILIFFFLLIMFLVVFDKVAFFDNFCYSLVRSLRSNLFDKYFVIVTKLGNSVTIVMFLICFIVILRNKYGLLLSISASNSVILNTVVKHIIRRNRPNGLRLIKETGYSFPSGHAMISISVYGYLLYLVITRVRNKYLRVILSIILSLLIISIGISRIYVGVHFASDVLAGYILATIQVILLVSVSNKVYGGTMNV